MTAMIMEGYDAMKAAGVDEARAKDAARVMSERDRRLEDQLVEVRSTLRLHTWQIAGLTGVVVALNLPILWMVARLSARLGVSP